MRDFLKNCQKITIKAGTSILTSQDGKISRKNLERLGLQMVHLLHQKKQIVLVIQLVKKS